MEKRRAAERKRFEADGDEHSGRGKETIYRDASGRIINVQMKRAEARKKMEQEAARAAAQVEAQKGDVQREQAAQRRQALQDAKFMPVARHADDEELNAELKQRERWGDPGADLMSSKHGASGSKKPTRFWPNRYGIRPGPQWDGVPRDNEFEKAYFAAQNKRKNHKELDYAWQMDE